MFGNNEGTRSLLDHFYCARNSHINVLLMIYGQLQTVLMSSCLLGRMCCFANVVLFSFFRVHGRMEYVPEMCDRRRVILHILLSSAVTKQFIVIHVLLHSSSLARKQKRYSIT